MKYPPTQDVNDALNRGLQFLVDHQLPSGQFPIQVTPRKPDARASDDFSNFATAHVLYSLSFFPADEVRNMLEPALTFLKREMSDSGLWRFWTHDAVRNGRSRFNFIPADLDDTASHAWALKHYGVPFPDNRRLLLHNRDDQGRFYTWMIPRLAAPLDPGYWTAMVKEITFPRMFLFWRISPAARNDVDSVVNANAVLYLGECSATAPVIRWLAQIVEEGREQGSDKWYHDLFTINYAVSRCHHAGVSGLGHLKSPVSSRINAEQKADGSIGDTPLHTALALNTLWNYEVSVDLPWVRSALAYLIDQQAPDGSWPSAPYYFGGPGPRRASWGSRELTTALCLEALVRSRKP